MIKDIAYEYKKTFVQNVTELNEAIKNALEYEMKILDSEFESKNIVITEINDFINSYIHMNKDQPGIGTIFGLHEEENGYSIMFSIGYRDIGNDVSKYTILERDVCRYYLPDDLNILCKKLFDIINSTRRSK